MYDRLKNFLLLGINVFVGLILLLCCGGYVLITSVIMTRVINDLRLDTYVTWDTGFGVVILILLLGWGPVWLFRAIRPSSRYTGRL